MRKLRTVFAVSALAAIALLIPATAQAGAPDRSSDKTNVAQLAWDWRG
ncbi:MAG TPA: hypothetical protein VFQ15_06935 [Jiangellaceae bacterium]|nr:hypothetical protein [Jiangellaceae bacterium]